MPDIDLHHLVKQQIATQLGQQLRAMSDDDFALFLNGVVETLEACKREHARRVLLQSAPAGTA
mgnify:CR=1 FL=1